MMRLISVALMLVALLTPLSHADECDQARHVYDAGKNTLNFESRRDLFVEAVKMCPHYAEAHVNLADAYENLEDFDAAERHYREASRLRNDFSVPYLGLGEVYLKTGRYDQAREAFVRGLFISPEDDRLLAGERIAADRLKASREFRSAPEITSCLDNDENFRLMCMCPGSYENYLRQWICVPSIFFASGSASLHPAARRQLDEIGKSLTSKSLTNRKWLVVGHTDDLGSVQSNERLSKERAERVREYLVKSFGLESEILVIKFFGQNRQRNSNTTFEGRSDNRRVEIIWTDEHER